MAEIIVVGSGIAGLTTACLATAAGHRVTILEQNWQAGGCSTGYWRKGFVFDSGATTLTGLDEGQPLHWLCQQTGIDLDAWPLELPMQVHLGYAVINRYPTLDAWVEECCRVFGPKGQRAFWTYAFRISRSVWHTSLRQRRFPPEKAADLMAMAQGFRFEQLGLLPLTFRSTEDLLRQFGLHDHAAFRRFVDEQLLITAQNHAPQVNALFGCAALCYTLFANHYLPGGMAGLVTPLVGFLEKNGNRILTRQRVITVRKTGAVYQVETDKATFTAPLVALAIPLNNALNIYPDIARRWHHKLMPATKLWSAWQMGVALQTNDRPRCLHHQIHLPKPLTHLDSKSLFLSFGHPDDNSRSDKPGHLVASISTHLANPDANRHNDGTATEEAVLQTLQQHGLVNARDVVYRHSSGPASWEKWTARAWGHVGGYPQYMRTKPWQMMPHRLDGAGAYICGDTTYPGQGIPGAALSGLIAWEKMRADHRL